MNSISKDDFVDFDNKLNKIFHLLTFVLEGRVRGTKKRFVEYSKVLKTLDLNLSINLNLDAKSREYIFYQYNFIFNNEKDKLLFHFEPYFQEKLQPHITFTKTVRL